MKADVGRLRGLARALGRRKKLRIALEFRDESWLVPEVYRAVEKAGWTVCLADWRGLAQDIPVLGPFCYIRRHGAAALYASRYSDAQIARDAEFATDTARAGRDVYFYYNNDAGAYAVQNARTLARMIGRKYLARAPKTWKNPR